MKGAWLCCCESLLLTTEEVVEENDVGLTYDDVSTTPDCGFRTDASGDVSMRCDVSRDAAAVEPELGKKRL